jgi:hypothetical protein
VAKSLIFGEPEIAFLAALVRHRVPFMIVGLSAATLQGVPAVTRDIDLWVEDLAAPPFQQAIRAAGAVYVPPSSNHPPRLGGPGADLMDLVVQLDGLGKFRDELAQALSVPVGRVTVRVLPLARIIASKRAANRPKDRLVLPVLEDAARAISASGRRPRSTTPRSRRRPRLE